VVHDQLRNQPQSFFHMALGSLQTAGLNVLRSKEIVLKSNVFVMSLTWIKIFLKIKCGNFLKCPRSCCPSFARSCSLLFSSSQCKLLHAWIFLNV
jgi:hypothetical protein